MSKRKLTYKDFINYFGNNLQSKDKHAFEKDMMQDAFEEEAFDGLSGLSSEELENDIAELKSNIQHLTRKNKRVIPVWLRYAAGILIIIGVGFSIVFFNSRYWQDSMLKEQVSKEMEAADSMVVEAEKLNQKADQEPDSVQEKPRELIADNKQIKSKKEEQTTPEKLVTGKINDEALISENEKESDEIVETLPAEEEGVEEEQLMVAGKLDELKPEIETEKNEELVTEVSTEEEVSIVLTGAVSGVEVKEDNKLAGTRIRGLAGTPKAEKKSEEKPKNATVIKGKIVGTDDDLSIPGVSVVLKDDPEIGTTTDIDGNFQLTIPESDEELKTLIASFVGMKSQEIDIENDTSLMVYMEPELLEMDEVVVVAYGVSRETNAEVPVKVGAKPPGEISRNNYKKQILDNLDYSLFSEFPGRHRVKVSFTVGENGDLYNFNFGDVPDVLFSSEIKRIIKELGNWIPATENDMNISSPVKLILKIEIEN